jgi:GPN-loop GTPase
MRNIYFVGTAGSGKSTMVSAYKEWLDSAGIDSIIVNLDPGAESIPYTADIDIREWISLADVMDEYALGPNGAQIVASDLMAVNINKLTNVLGTYKTKYVLIDTPGQLELFSFRESSNVIVDALGKDKSMVAYLSDPMLCRTANGFVSSMTLAALVQFRLQLPTFNILSKADTLVEDEKDKLLNWYTDPYALEAALIDDDVNPQTVVGTELFRALDNIGMFGEMRAASAKEAEGLEEIYAASQLLFFAGEDPEPDD